MFLSPSPSLWKQRGTASQGGAAPSGRSAGGQGAGSEGRRSRFGSGDDLARFYSASPRLECPGAASPPGALPAGPEARGLLTKCAFLVRRVGLVIAGDGFKGRR